MNEYVIPVKYRNIGCGISAKVAGLETRRNDYRHIFLSIDNVNFVEVGLNKENLDISDIVTFDNLDENKYYTIYGKIVMHDDEVVNLSAKIVSQVQTATSEVPFEIRKRRYLGGGLIKNEVI